MSAVSLIVTPLFCSILPVVDSNRTTALSTDEAGPCRPALARNWTKTSASVPTTSVPVVFEHTHPYPS